MVHIHNGILVSHKRNTFESVLMRWMKPEPVIQNEVSQEKHKSCILTHMYGIWNDSNDDPTHKAAKETQMLRIDFLTQWEKGRVG